MKPFALVMLLALTLLTWGCGPGSKLTFDPNQTGADIDDSPSSSGNEDSLPPALDEDPSAVAFPESSRKFDRAWMRRDTAIVIDAYQGNSIDWTRLKTDSRLAGIIHRSSVGLRADTSYVARQELAKKHGLLWGAYHLGKSGDPIAQAKFFLKTVGDHRGVLLALDLEDTSRSDMMSIADAKIFMDYVYRATGRVPVVYANHNVTMDLNNKAWDHPLFKQSLLWYARFRPDIPQFPEGIWKTYFLWQFSSEINCQSTGKCLYNVPGTSFDMDVNVFFGTRKALANLWAR